MTYYSFSDSLMRNYTHKFNNSYERSLNGILRNANHKIARMTSSIYKYACRF